MAVSGTEKLTERRAEQLAELLLNNLESVSTPLLLRLNNESFRIRFKREASEDKSGGAWQYPYETNERSDSES